MRIRSFMVWFIVFERKQQTYGIQLRLPVQPYTAQSSETQL